MRRGLWERNRQAVKARTTCTWPVSFVERVYWKQKTSDRNLAHEIKQQLLHDFSNRSEMSDWFSRDDTVTARPALRPNPRNESNKAKIQDLEQRIARYDSAAPPSVSILSANWTDAGYVPSGKDGKLSYRHQPSLSSCPSHHNCQTPHR